MALPITASAAWVSAGNETLLATIGIGLVVAVFVGLLSMASGFRLALRASGSAENAIVLEKGANVGTRVVFQQGSRRLGCKRFADRARW